MNRDTYARFLRSEAYKELLIGGKKKVSSLTRFSSSKNRKSAHSLLLFRFIFFLQSTRALTQTHKHSKTKDACARVAGSLINGVHSRWTKKKSQAHHSIIFFFCCCSVFSCPKNTNVNRFFYSYSTIHHIIFTHLYIHIFILPVSLSFSS